MAKPLRRDFDNLDRTTDPNAFVSYLDTVRQTDFFREVKRQTIAAMELHAGEFAVDVGCGTGEDVSEIAQLVAPTGRAIGIDVSATMVETARQRHPLAEFARADAHKLPFEDASIDAIRAERLLQHTRHPEAVLQEMTRVLKPTGRIVIYEGDLDLFLIDAPDYEVSRILQRRICDQFVNGAIGHRLYGMFLDAHLASVQTHPLLRPIFNLDLIESAFDLSANLDRVISDGLLDRQRAQGWLDSLRSAARAGRFSCVIGGFITTASKSSE